jgi:hypothetical protein
MQSDEPADHVIRDYAAEFRLISPQDCTAPKRCWSGSRPIDKVSQILLVKGWEYPQILRCPVRIAVVA